MYMKKDEEVDSLIKKISTEIDTVKNHIKDAKYNLSINNYNNAIEHLKEAKTTSTCSYCQQKIDKFLADIEYATKLCSINYKTCDETKNNTTTEMQSFIDKLPSISDIRKTKATNTSQDFDIIGNIAKSFDEMGKSFGKMFENMFKF